MNVKDFIQENEKSLQKLNRLGYKKNSTLLTHFKMYQDFQRLKDLPTMQKYSELAEKYKVSETVVRGAIMKMKKII